MAPNYGVVLPIAETIDRRGQNMNVGIGDANLSWLGSAIEGYQTGAANQLNIETRRLELQDRYNPERLLQEQLQRELKTRDAELAIQKAERALPYEERRLQAAIAATEAGTDLTRQQARATDIKSDFAEKYGDIKERLDIEKTRVDIQKSRADMLNDAYKIMHPSQASAKSLETQIRADYATRTKLLDAEYSFLKPEFITSVANTKNKLKRLSETPKEEWNQGDKVFYETNVPLVAAHDEYKAKAAQLSVGYANDIAYARSGSSQGEPGEAPSLADQHMMKMQEIFAEQDGVMQEAAMTTESLNADVDTMAANANRKYIVKEKLRLDSAKEAVKGISEGLDDIDAAGNPNYTAAQKHLQSLVHHYEKSDDPGVKKAIAASVMEAVEKGGGIKNWLDYGKTFKDTDEKSAWDKSVVSIATMMDTSQMKNFPKEQRLFQALNLPAEDIANPEETMKGFSQLVAGKAVNVDSDAIRAFQTNDFVSAYRQLSQGGTVGVNVETKHVGAGENGEGAIAYVFTPTSGGQDPIQLQADKYMEQDPTTGKMVHTPETQAIMDVLNQITEDSQKAKTKQANAPTPENIEATAQAGIQKQQTPAPMNTGAKQERQVVQPKFSLAGMTTLTFADIADPKDPTKVKPEVKADLAGQLGLASIQGGDKALLGKIGPSMDKLLASAYDNEFKTRGGEFLSTVAPSLDDRLMNNLLYDVTNYMWSSLSPEEKKILVPGQGGDIAFRNQMEPRLRKTINSYMESLTGKLQKGANEIRDSKKASLEAQLAVESNPMKQMMLEQQLASI